MAKRAAKHFEMDAELKRIISMDTLKVMLWAMIGIPLLAVHASYCTSAGAFAYNLSAILLLIAAYLAGAVLIHIERKNFPMGRKHGGK